MNWKDEYSFFIVKCAGISMIVIVAALSYGQFILPQPLRDGINLILSNMAINNHNLSNEMYKKMRSIDSEIATIKKDLENLTKEVINPP